MGASHQLKFATTWDVYGGGGKKRERLFFSFCPPLRLRKKADGRSCVGVKPIRGVKHFALRWNTITLVQQLLSRTRTGLQQNRCWCWWWPSGCFHRTWVFSSNLKPSPFYISTSSNCKHGEVITPQRAGGFLAPSRALKPKKPPTPSGSVPYASLLQPRKELVSIKNQF